MPIKIDFISNVRDLLRGTKNVEDALDDVADSLDDVVRDGDQSLGRLEKSFRDVAREARDTGKDIEKGIGDSTRDGAKKAKVGLDDVKDEARQSGAEAAASFSGEFTDGLDFAQEVTANLGPAGIAGGLLIGAVGAVATAAVEAWNEKIQGIKDATASMWQEAAAAGQEFLAQDAINAEASRINWDSAYDEQRRAAEEAGVSRLDLAIALASGEGEVYDRVHRQILQAREEERQAAVDSITASTDGNVALQDAVATTNSELARTVSVLEEKAKATDENKRRAQEAGDIEKALQEQTRDQINRTADAAQSRYEGLAKLYGKPIKAVVEFDTRGLDQLESRVNVLQQRAAEGITIRVNPGQGRFYE